jgi:prepilin-type N-terminal cleavage/methylation domain-containing protein
MICQSLAKQRSARGGGIADHNGFTFLEAVVVLLLLGVMSAVAISKYSTSNISAATEADLFKASLRYAQQRAMGDISTWGLTVEADGYSLFSHNPGFSGTSPILPGVGANKRTLSDGVTMSVSNAVGQDIVFDYRGRLVGSGGAGDAAGAEYLKTGPLAVLGNNITVTFTGETGKSITVYANTGFAQ